jgi:hypothetical protein
MFWSGITMRSWIGQFRTVQASSSISSISGKEQQHNINDNSNNRQKKHKLAAVIRHWHRMAAAKSDPVHSASETREIFRFM